MIPSPPQQINKEHKIFAIYTNGEDSNAGLAQLVKRLDEGWEIQRVDATKDTLVYILCMTTIKAT